MSAAPAIERHAPGTFCWVELGTPAPEEAKAFYTNLFGWTFEDAAEGMYTTWKLHGLEHGAMQRMISDGSAANWLLYVAVKDVDRTLAKAEQQGASILVQATDVMEHGRMGVLRDPEGAVLAVWRARKHIGARIINTTGTLCWAELTVDDPAAAARFYTTLFGWHADTRKSGPPGEETEYTEWIVEGMPIGGMLQKTAEWGEAPPYWMPYFQVIDCAESVEKAKKLGGHVECGPFLMENVGRFASIGDPRGARFSIIELNLAA